MKSPLPKWKWASINRQKEFEIFFTAGTVRPAGAKGCSSLFMAGVFHWRSPYVKSKKRIWEKKV